VPFILASSENLKREDCQPWKRFVASRSPAGKTKTGLRCRCVAFGTASVSRRASTWYTVFGSPLKLLRPAFFGNSQSASTGLAPHRSPFRRGLRGRFLSSTARFLRGPERWRSRARDPAGGGFAYNPAIHHAQPTIYGRTPSRHFIRHVGGKATLRPASSAGSPLHAHVGFAVSASRVGSRRPFQKYSPPPPSSYEDQKKPGMRLDRPIFFFRSGPCVFVILHSRNSSLTSSYFIRVFGLKPAASPRPRPPANRKILLFWAGPWGSAFFPPFSFLYFLFPSSPNKNHLERQLRPCHYSSAPPAFGATSKDESTNRVSGLASGCPALRVPGNLQNHQLFSPPCAE